MLYTLMLGAPVHSGDRALGAISRIIANNGVVNQFTVNPAGLFSGPDRVVPISDVVEATAERVTLNISDVEWKAYSAFNIEHLMVSDRAAAPELIMSAPRSDTTSEMFDVPTAEAPAGERTVSDTVVVLTTKTRVGDDQRLAGLVVDTGIPQQVIVEGGNTIPYAHVGSLGEDHIVLGETPERMDGATLPGSLGDAPAHVANSLTSGTPGQAEPGRKRRVRVYGRD